MTFFSVGRNKPQKVQDRIASMWAQIRSEVGTIHPHYKGRVLPLHSEMLKAIRNNNNDTSRNKTSALQHNKTNVHSDKIMHETC